jgi:choline-sulfatase
MSKTDKPNILFIWTDQQNVNVSGLYGDKIAKTPNLDRLGGEGITFDAAYSTSPLCVPARLSLTSGKYISRKGVQAWNNASWLPSNEIPSLATEFQKNGYETYMCGKMHYDYCRRYGFTDLLLYKKGGGNTHTKTGITTRIDYNENTLHKWENPSGSLKLGIGIEPKSKKRTFDTIRTEKTIEFLSNRKNSDNPFLYVLGFVMPHPQFSIDEELYSYYKDKVRLPKIEKDEINILPKNYQKRRHISSIGTHYEEDAPIHTEEEIKKIRAVYYGMVEWIDIQLGLVLEALKKSDVADNTIVIFTTDHGESLGNKGLWGKSNMYDFSSKVPLVIRYPKRWKGGQRRSGACSYVDVIQMMGEITGTRLPNDWDGESLLPYLDDSNYNWKDYAISEMYALPYSGVTMLRKGEWKYVYHSKIQESMEPEFELYNMNEDPLETINLANDPIHKSRIKKMHRILEKELGEPLDEIEKRCRSQEPYYKEPSWFTVRGRNKKKQIKKRLKKELKAKEKLL